LGTFRIVELGAIAASELIVPIGVVVVPMPQIGRRCDLLAPLVEMSPLFAEPARPEPVNEHALTVIRLWRIVDPPDLDATFMGHDRSPWRHHRLGTSSIPEFVVVRVPSRPSAHITSMDDESGLAY
jgi:hypothetical protein